MKNLSELHRVAGRPICQWFARATQRVLDHSAKLGMPLPGLRGSAVRFKRFRGCGNARFMLLITGILLILAACAASSSAPVDDEAALKTVQAFVAALEARDPSAVLAILEPADWRREIGPELRSYMSYVEALEFQNPAYELLANDGNTAEIRLRADLRYRLRDFEPGEQAVDTVFELVRIDDEWYLRSLNLPTPGS